MIKHYESIQHLRQDYLDRNCNQSRSHPATNSWYGNETLKQTLYFSLHGNDELVPEAEELISQLDTEIQTPRKHWAPSVAGAFPCVPDYLRGLPTSMRRQVEIQSETSPINIYVDIGTSVNIPSELIKKRGIVVLALCLILTRQRALSLHVIDCCKDSHDPQGQWITIARVNTQPLDLSTACYALTSSGFPRRLVYELEGSYGASYGEWPRGYNPYSSDDFYSRLARTLNLNPKFCLFVKAAHVNEPLVTDPLGWIKQQLTNFNQEGE